MSANLDRYSFRTNVQDDYISRVLAEVDANSNFLVIVDENKITKEQKLSVYVRKPVTALAVLFPEEKLGPETLAAWFEEAVESTANGTNKTDFVGLSIEGDAEGLAKERETIEQQIRHLDNVIKGRIIQVTVDTY